MYHILVYAMIPPYGSAGIVCGVRKSLCWRVFSDNVLLGISCIFTLVVVQHSSFWSQPCPCVVFCIYTRLRFRASRKMPPPLHRLLSFPTETQSVHPPMMIKSRLARNQESLPIIWFLSIAPQMSMARVELLSYLQEEVR